MLYEIWPLVIVIFLISLYSVLFIGQFDILVLFFIDPKMSV